MAEIAARARFAMGLGGFLAARTDQEHCESELRCSAPKPLAPMKNGGFQFMMRFELGLEKPDPRRAVRTAATIGASYVVGGLISLAPIFFLTGLRAALAALTAVTLSALVVFGLSRPVLQAFPCGGRLSNLPSGGLAGGGGARYCRSFPVTQFNQDCMAFASTGRLKPDSGDIIFSRLIISIWRPLK
jgi:hypothetical protein